MELDASREQKKCASSNHTRRVLSIHTQCAPSNDTQRVLSNCTRYARPNLTQRVRSTHKRAPSNRARRVFPSSRAPPNILLTCEKATGNRWLSRM